MGGLSDVRVVELAGGVGLAYAAKLFADLGADVVRLERAGGQHNGDASSNGDVGGDVGGGAAADLVRSRPFEVHRWLNTNKRSMWAGPGRLDELLAGADLLVHDLGPSAAARANVDQVALAARYPSLVLGTLTPYGQQGPWADVAGGELTVSHASSWGFLSPAAATDIDLPPLKAPGHHASLMSATVAATAFLAAVDRAQRSGVGEHVDFSAMAAGAKLTETAPATASFLGADASRIGARTVVPWSIYPCRDGLLQFICVEEAQWQALVSLMGDPEWAQLEVFATNADRRANADLVELYLAEWMATHTVQELFELGQQHRLCMAPVYRMDQLADDAQLNARRFFATDPDGRRLPGPGFRSDQGWWGLRRAAPEAGQHDGESWRDRPARLPGGPRPLEGGPARPLEGIRVCDFTWIWAGPYCTQLLAHLGADVVRIESPEHLCLFRRLPFHPAGVEPTPDSDGLFQLYNSDKRSIAVDLGQPAARQIVERMIARADVVVENFAAGTLAALGYSVEEIRAINPDAIIVSITGFGQDGPYAEYMAYGPSGGAFAGLYAANGYEGGPAMETGIAIGDPGTGLTAAWAAVASIVARRHHGAAARIDVAMVEAIATTIGELWMQYQTTGEAPGPAGNHDPQWAPHNVYATGEDEWLAIACTSDAAFRALVGVMGADDAAGAARLAEERFATAAGRKANEAELDEVIAAWLHGGDREVVCARLQQAGVAAVPSLSPMVLWSGHEQLAATGMLEQPEHPVTGRHTVPGIPWRLARAANGLRRPAPTLGQHTDEVLAELGFDAAEVDALRQAGAIPRSPVPTGMD